MHSLPRNQPANGQHHRSVGKIQLPLESLAVLRRLEPDPIHALVDDMRTIDGGAQRHATVAHEGAEVDGPIRCRQQASDGAIVVGIVAAAVVDVNVNQDVGTA